MTAGTPGDSMYPKKHKQRFSQTSTIANQLWMIHKTQKSVTFGNFYSEISNRTSG